MLQCNNLLQDAQIGVITNVVIYKYLTMYQVHYILCMYTLHCTRYTISIANYPLLHIYTSQCTTGTLYQVHSVLYRLQDGQAGVITKEPLTAAAAVISGSLVQWIVYLQSSLVHCVIIGTRVRAMDCLVPGPLHWSEAMNCLCLQLSPTHYEPTNTRPKNKLQVLHCFVHSARL